MQFVTRTYIYHMQTRAFLTMDVSPAFRYSQHSQKTDLQAPTSTDNWNMNFGTDFGQQAEDVINWLHRFTDRIVDKVTRQETLDPVRLEYRPTPQSRKWRTGHTLPKYVPALHDPEAQKLADQEGWAEWRYTDY